MRWPVTIGPPWQMASEGPCPYHTFLDVSRPSHSPASGIIKTPKPWSWLAQSHYNLFFVFFYSLGPLGMLSARDVASNLQGEHLLKQPGDLMKSQSGTIISQRKSINVLGKFPLEKHDDNWFVQL